MVGLRPTLADEPLLDKPYPLPDFLVLSLPGFPVDVSIGTSLLAVIKHSAISETKFSEDNLCFSGIPN